MVYYNPLVVTFDELSAHLRGKLRDVGEADLSVRKIVQIPVCYGGEYGPDLANVAAHAGLTPQLSLIHISMPAIPSRAAHPSTSRISATRRWSG